MPDKLKGEHTSLMTVWEKLNQEYSALSPEEIAELKNLAEEEQHAKVYIPKQTMHAQQHDVANVANSFQEAVSVECLNCIVVLIFCKLNALNTCTGHVRICILVCSKSSMNADLIVLKTSGIDQFFKDMTNKSMLTIVGELNAWCTSGLRGNLYLLIISQYIQYYLITTGLATEKKSLQECKK